MKALRIFRGAILLQALLLFLIPAPVFAAPPQEGARPPLRILISNDDGVDSPGIIALFEKLLALGTVTVAAPSQNNSGVGHALTFDGPIAVEQSEKRGMIWYSIAARPATCVRLAVSRLLAEKPDIVASGINRGENLGLVTFSSGTSGCAREAAYYGIPAVAFSLQSGEVMDYGAAADIAAEIIAAVRGMNLKPGVFLNVNIPALPREAIRGVRITRQCLQPPADIFELETTPEGKKKYRSIYMAPSHGELNTDVWAVENGYVSVTPLRIDQTVRREIAGLEALSLMKLKENPRPGRVSDRTGDYGHGRQR